MEITQVVGVDRATAFADGELDILKNQFKVQAIGFYLGGPFYSINGWNKDDVQRCIAKGFHVMPIYVGQNVTGGPIAPKLTAVQAVIDGVEAVRLLNEFGFSDPKGIGISLDVERTTFDYNNEECTAYADEWCNAVAIHGATPGCYGALELFDHMISTNRAPGFMWLASWVAKGFDSKLSLSDMPGVPNSIFTEHQRCWQYAGNVSLPGLASPVDINLFDITKVVNVEAPAEPISQIAATTVITKAPDVEGAKELLQQANALMNQAHEKLTGA